MTTASAVLRHELGLTSAKSVRTLLVALCAALIVALTAAPVGAEEKTNSEGQLFGQLAREQSLSESYVGLLNQFGKEDVNVYARGIQLYAVAKADFDGLIEQLKNDLISGRKLNQSEQYKAALLTAVEHRIAFTTHIDKEILAKDAGKRGGIAAVLTTVAALLPALTKVGEAIWNAYHKAKKDQRQQILDQLDGLKWKPFHEIGAKQ